MSVCCALCHCPRLQFTGTNFASPLKPPAADIHSSNRPRRRGVDKVVPLSNLGALKSLSCLSLTEEYFQTKIEMHHRGGCQELVQSLPKFEATLPGFLDTVECLRSSSVNLILMRRTYESCSLPCCPLRAFAIAMTVGGTTSFQPKRYAGSSIKSPRTMTT